jgi:iron-sulfur cluster repair protein YtfE (RIC family)
MAKRSTQLLNALDLLTEQHAEVDALFERLEGEGDADAEEDEEDGGDGGDRKAAFVELADKLAAHATIEEKLFYPRVMSEQTSDLLHQAVEEHLAVKRVLADMVTMDLDADEFKAKLAVLKEEVSHHAHEEEEAKLFPMLRKSMDPEDLAGLGNELLVMFEQLLASEPRFEVPKETVEAAPLRA